MRFYTTPDNKIKLINADCFAVMPRIAAGSVDMIMADLPYGTTQNKWDRVLPLDSLWANYLYVTKNNAAIVLTAQTPFDKVLGCSNLDMLKYEWIWNKSNPTGHLNAKKQPMKEHENILVFYYGSCTYNRQMRQLTTPLVIKRGVRIPKNIVNYSQFDDDPETIYTELNPRTILSFASERGKHPTQKPVALMEYFIKTYTNPDELVLDNVMGSGTTGVACINTNRRCIGIELDETYFDIAVKRCEEAYNNKVQS